MPDPLRLMRWVDVLLAISRSRKGKSYCECLCRQLHCSRTYIRVVANKLAKCQLIEIILKDNTKQLVLTERGKRVAALLRILRHELPIQSCQ